MTEAYDGRQVAGIDLHRRRSVIVRMTEDGRKLGTVRITNSAAAPRAVIARAEEHLRVVIEATYGWYWAADVLEEARRGGALGAPAGGEGQISLRPATRATERQRTHTSRLHHPAKFSGQRDRPGEKAN